MSPFQFRRLHRGTRLVPCSLATVFTIAVASVSLAGAQGGSVTAGPRDARSAPSHEPPPLTLDAVFVRLAAHNPRLTGARAEADAATARVAPARTLPDPRVQLGLMNRDLPSLRPMETLGMDQLQVMQLIPIGGKRGSAGRAAEARAASARARASARWWDLRRDAAVIFYELWATDRRLAVARETQALLARAADAAASIYGVGQGRLSDVLRAQMEITRMSDDLIRMQAMRATLAARLGGLLLVDVDPDTVTLRILRLGALLAGSVTDSTGRLDRLAQAHRPMLSAGRHEVSAAAESEQLARQDLWPDIELGVQLARRPPSAAPPGMPATTDWMTSLMVGASVPLFARSRQLQMRTEAAAMRTMAEADVTAMEAETRAMVHEGLAMLRQSRALQALYAGTLWPQAVAARDAAFAAYRAGHVDFITLLEAHMTANRVRQEQYVVRAAEGKAIAELEMLTGRSLTDGLALLPLEDEIR